jgi:hypothetical protein
MDEFKSPKMLIIDHYDSMIRQLDIFTEELLDKCEEKDLENIMPKDDFKYKENDDSKSRSNDIDEFEDPYSEKYKYDMNKIVRIDGVPPGTTRFRDYIELVRTKSIEELKKAQQETLDSYEINKSLYKYDRETLTDEKVEEMRKNLFKDKFCFTLQINIDSNKKFKQITVFTDFYLNQEDLTHLK